jgi:FrmR/RcnR family transcriptional regulator, repressor of rcnA expression
MRPLLPSRPITPRGVFYCEAGETCDGARLFEHPRIPYPVSYVYHTPYAIKGSLSTLSHTKSEKLKLLNRVRRVRGQIEAVERALEEEKGCATVLHLIVAARGAMNSLMTEVIEDHIRLHVVDPARDSERTRGAEELIEAVQAYLK